MPLKIQHEESLLSYVERTRLFFWKQPEEEILPKDLSKYVTSYRIKLIASALGWEGCRGFNKLLHFHTHHFNDVIFKNRRDLSYSGRKYVNAEHVYGGFSGLSFCPSCVREDIASLGFPYWRRTHSNGNKVCAVHNIRLVEKCPFCSQSLSSDGHGLRMLWDTCGGRHISECQPEKNYVAGDLKQSVFLNDALNYDFFFCQESALRVLQCRQLKSFEALDSCGTDARQQSLSAISKMLRVIQEGHAVNASVFQNYSTKILALAMETYESFSDFADDLLTAGCPMEPVDQVWATYRSGGYESAHFVAEDYKLGVGYWSSPYPSDRSLDPTSQDGFRRRQPKIYPCCNPTCCEPVSAVSRTRIVRTTAPGIPILR